MRWLALAAALMPAAAFGQSVMPCDWRARADAIAEPWAENTRTFANGAVRLALIDTLEPALAAFHLLVLSPPYDEIGDRQCRILSAEGSLGFSALHFEDLTAKYVPGEGLHFAVPAIRTDGSDQHASYMLSFVLNQATGGLSARLEPASQ